MYTENYKDQINMLLESGNLADAKVLLDKEMNAVESLMEKFNVLAEKAINASNNKVDEIYHLEEAKDKIDNMIFEKKKQIMNLNAEGRLTEEEASAIINKLDKTQVVMESRINSKADNTTPVELFEATKLSLYEKCENGEITLEEREAMIREAFANIMQETLDGPDTADIKGIQADTSTDLRNAADDKDVKNMAKDAEKKIDSIAKEAEKNTNQATSNGGTNL